ncbi:hypothetical protein ACROYT_G030686 [Oculina patagonica]
MTKIPYENEYGFQFSKKGKMPWIEFNGQEVADSNFCIQFLKKELQVDIDSHLSAREKAIAHSIRTMLEENTFWVNMSFRICRATDTKTECGQGHQKKTGRIKIIQLDVWVSS